MPSKKSYQTSLDQHKQPVINHKKRKPYDSHTNHSSNDAQSVQDTIRHSKFNGNKIGNHEVSSNDDNDVSENNPEEQAIDDTNNTIQLTKSGKSTQDTMNKHQSEQQYDIERGTITNVNQLPVVSRVHRDRIRLVSTDANKIEFNESTVLDAAYDNTNINQKKQASIVYWMQRDQRADDNWALLYASELAHKYNYTLYVVYSLPPTFLAATYRHYYFMLKGLEEVEQELRGKYNIPFHLLLGEAHDNILKFVTDMNCAVVITDFDALRITQLWQSQVYDKLSPLGIPLICVDTHNIVPVWCASNKLEIGARTLRPKIHRLLPEYLHEFPLLQKQSNDKQPIYQSPSTDWKHVHDSVTVDRSVLPVDWLVPGPTAANKILKQFIDIRIKKYAEKRNDPSFDSVSNLSPYLHFGQLSPQRAIIDASRDEVKKRNPTGSAAFVEEALVRRELSDNWCYYNQNGYDKLSGTYEWARQSLDKHRVDPRPEKFTLGELEFAVTYDPLWNAAQLQAIQHGKIHGYMRMYWAKKILEWTDTPELALEYSMYLNDRYSIDGRDPNGYVGCMWSIVGVHDRGWTERPVFGKIRYMNYNGCKRKFDVDKFISQYPEAIPGTNGFKENQNKAKQFDINFMKYKPDLATMIPTQNQDGTLNHNSHTPTEYIGGNILHNTPSANIIKNQKH